MVLVMVPCVFSQSVVMGGVSDGVKQDVGRIEGRLAERVTMEEVRAGTDWWSAFLLWMGVETPEGAYNAALDGQLELMVRQDYALDDNVLLVDVKVIQNDSYYDEVAQSYVDDMKVLDQYQEVVSSTETYIIGQDEYCYVDTITPDSFVCENKWRCDNQPGLEPWCAPRYVSKHTSTDGNLIIDTPTETQKTILMDVHSRAEVLETPELLNDERFTAHMQPELVQRQLSKLMVSE